MSLYLKSGQCPQCLLEKKSILIRKNETNFWECPECHLQLLIEHEKAVIFRFRGKGLFAITPTSLQKEYVLEETGEDSYQNGIKIHDVHHLADYLSSKVERVNEFTIDSLIDAYVHYKYGHHSNEKYLKLSKHFDIDFEDSSIEEQLELRDRERKHSFLYLHSRLYRFLKKILEKYYNNDNSWLPEMGMSKIEHYLCTKHFSIEEKNIVDSNLFLVQQCLRELAKDLISIIYLDEKVILSYDLEEQQSLSNEFFEK